VDALKRPAALALAAMLLAACGGGGDNPTKVAAKLQGYMDTLRPVPSGFPLGAGPPHVKKKGCKKISQAQARQVRPRRRPLASWSCVVTFAHVPFRVLVALKDSGEVAWVKPLSRQALSPGTATVYQGGPKQPKP
jgi:hypothetical protein